jgi:dihydrofolate synthase/folylpolyglutamate synthase
MNSTFTSYGEATGWLYGTQLFGIKLGLDNVHRLLSALSLPAEGQQFIHVAGTNGKGSVCALTDALLQESGLRTGLFTSPHLVSFCERMRVNDLCIPEGEVAARLSRLRQTVADWEAHPTFFELALALALDWFRDDDAEIVVLETGLGGRLDATNAITPAASVITPIALDHQKWLGDSLEAIAKEKAGILKPGVPAVSAVQLPEVEAVLTQAAEEVGAPLRILGKDDLAEVASVRLGLEGPHQVANAALALAGVRAAGIAVDDQDWVSALEGVRWRARFERALADRLIVDAAHNEHAAAALAETWKAAFGDEKACLIFGAVEDKPHAEMLKALAPIAGEIIYVGVNSARAVPPDKLAEFHPDPAIPFRLALNLKSLPPAGDARRLIAGSLFLAGEAISRLDEAIFEASAQ